MTQRVTPGVSIGFLFHFLWVAPPPPPPIPLPPAAGLMGKGSPSAHCARNLPHVTSTGTCPPERTGGGGRRGAILSYGRAMMPSRMDVWIPSGSSEGVTWHENVNTCPHGVGEGVVQDRSPAAGWSRVLHKRV